MKICFATNNGKKIEEIRNLLEPTYQVISLQELGVHEDIPEEGTTLEENSLQKAQYVFEKFGIACFADDTGLEVEALGGEPGVFSARYAGPQRNNEDNIQLLLRKLEKEGNRNAQFRTIITYITENGTVHQFDGIVKGSIVDQKRGDRGFGYDPVFMPEGYSKTFAEMPLEAKNEISHRGRAIKKFVEFLK